MAPAGPGTTDASRKAVSRLDSAAQSGAATENTTVLGQSISPPTDQPAALRRAAETGDLRRLREILATEVRIDAPDASGRTALMLAASRGQTESVNVLLAHGADPNAADALGQTPLKAAIAADHPAIVAALRRAGAR
jgi:ankyrin repeat protein